MDTSSGSLGNAVNTTVNELLDLLLTVPADEPTWERWRDRLWSAVEEDGVDYLSEVVERWGELCRTPERASRAADDWVSVVRLRWSPEHRGYFRGTTGCQALSAAATVGRLRQTQALIAGLIQDDTTRSVCSETFAASPMTHGHTADTTASDQSSRTIH